MNNTLQRYIVTAVVTALILFLVWFFSDIVGYILISAILSFMGKPLVTLLTSIKFRGKEVVAKWVAALITLLFMWFLTISFLMVFAPIVTDKISALSNFNINDLTQTLEIYIGRADKYLSQNFAIDVQHSPKGLIDTIKESINFTIADSIKSIGALVGTVTNIFILAFSVSFMTFFFLKESNLFINGVTILFSAKAEGNALRAINSSVNLLSRYFIGLMVESFIKLVVVTAGFYFIGVPFSDALFAALITSILNVIPYIGPLIGGVMAVVVAITSPELMAAPLQMPIIQMVIVLMVFQLIDNIIIQPYVYAESVKAHPLEIFIVILMAGSIAGVLGMLLAIPVYTLLRVFSKEFFTRFRVVQKLTENI